MMNLLVRLFNLFSLEVPLNGGFVVDELTLEGGGLSLEDGHVLQLLQELVLVDNLQRASGLVRATKNAFRWTL